MTHRFLKLLTASALLTLGSPFMSEVKASEVQEATTLSLRQEPFLKAPEVKSLPKKFFYDSGVDIAYPEDGVKGIYLTANSAGSTEKMDDMISYLNSNDLNAMVIDIKDDFGYGNGETIAHGIQETRHV